MSETNLREVVARIAKLVKGLPERVLSVEKGYAQLATELSELKERLESLDKSSDSTAAESDGFQNLNRNDVIKIPDKNDRLFLDYATFQSEEWLESFSDFLRTNINTDRYEEWIKAGIECQLLPASGGGWRSGKLRLNIEFCPDDAEETED